MENILTYWFYLEPYTFIFRSENKFVLYNTLNSSYIEAPASQSVTDMMNLLDDASNGYCIVLTEEQIKEPAFHQFAMKVRDTFSGDLVESESDTKKPFIFKPVLFLNTDIRKAKEEDFSFLGERVLENLNEVSVYLPGKCNKKCKDCKSYHKQMLHCTQFEDIPMTVSNYLSLLLELNSSGVNKVNILGSDLTENEYLADLYPTLSGCKFKKVFYVDFVSFTDKCIEWLKDDTSMLCITVHTGYDQNELETQMNRWGSYNILWNFVVTSDVDLNNCEALNIPVSAQTGLIPYYNGSNLQFFRENIFSSIEDIIAEPVSKKTIFRRQALNENFFGKLTLLPSGEIYANLNCSPIGKYPFDSLKKIVFKELTGSTAWFLPRDQEPCASCVNKYLCPSISNYELVLGKHNLCLIE